MKIDIDQNIHLELVCSEHAEAMFHLIDQHRDYLRKWMTFVDRTHSVTDVLAYTEEAQRRHVAGTEYAFAIFYLGEMVGRAALHKVDPTRGTGELAAWLAVTKVAMLRRARPDTRIAGQRSKGIVDLAMLALIDFGFGTLKLTRIEIRAAVGNDLANAVAKRLNFTPAGIISQSKQIRDLHTDVAIYFLNPPAAGTSVGPTPDHGSS